MTVQRRTHQALDTRLCGEVLTLEEGRAEVAMTTVPEMAADGSGLVHGGFVFGLADHAVMLAVNHPNVVLGQAESRFLRPVRVGEGLVAEAEVEAHEGKKILVSALVRQGDREVLRGSFVCFTPERHVLEAGP